MLLWKPLKNDRYHGSAIAPEVIEYIFVAHSMFDHGFYGCDSTFLSKEIRQTNFFLFLYNSNNRSFYSCDAAISLFYLSGRVYRISGFIYFFSGKFFPV
jgi:hypothetical protein